MCDTVYIYIKKNDYLNTIIIMEAININICNFNDDDDDNEINENDIFTEDTC